MPCYAAEQKWDPMQATHSLPPLSVHTHTHTRLQPQATRSSHLAEFKGLHRPLRSIWTYDGRPTMREKMTFCSEMWFPSACVCIRALHMCWLPGHLHWRICPVSLSLLVAILNLAVWCAPATFDLRAAESSTWHPLAAVGRPRGGPVSVAQPRRKVKWRSHLD